MRRSDSVKHKSITHNVSSSHGVRNNSRGSRHTTTLVDKIQSSTISTQPVTIPSQEQCSTVQITPKIHQSCQDIVHTLTFSQHSNGHNNAECLYQQKSNEIIQQNPSDCMKATPQSLLQVGLSLSDNVAKKVSSQLNKLQSNDQIATPAGQYRNSLLCPGSKVFQNTGLVIRSALMCKVRNNVYPYKSPKITAPGIFPKAHNSCRTGPLRAITGSGNSGQEPTKEQSESQSDMSLDSSKSDVQSSLMSPLESGKQEEMYFSSALAHTMSNLQNCVISRDDSSINRISSDIAHISSFVLNPGSVWCRLSDTVSKENKGNHEIVLKYPKEVMDVTNTPSANTSPFIKSMASECCKYSLDSDINSGCSQLGPLTSQSSINDRKLLFSEGQIVLEAHSETTDQLALQNNESQVKDKKIKIDEFISKDKQPSTFHLNLKVMASDSEETKSEISKFDQSHANINNYFVGFRTIQDTVNIAECITASEPHVDIVRPFPVRLMASSEASGSHFVYNQEQGRHTKENSRFHLMGKKTDPATYMKFHCWQCKKVYRWPHLLTCYHSLCYPCILAKYDSGCCLIRCPLCCIITRLPRGVTNLTLNMQLCKDMTCDQISPFNCTSCMEEKKSHKYCKTCEQFLCMDCLHLHTESVRHIIGPLAKVAFGTDGQLLHSCDDHPGNPVEMYCRTCSMLVCTVCLSNKHETHNICRFESMMDEARKRVLQINMVYASMQTGCRKQIQILNNLKQQMEGGDKKLRNEIHLTCNSLIDTIGSSEKFSRLLVNKAHDEIVAKFQQILTEFKIYKDVHDHFQELIPRYIHMDNLDEFTVCFDHLVKTMENLKNFYATSPLANPKFNVDLKFEPDYREFNSAVHECFQCIQFQHNLKLDRFNSSPLLENVLFSKSDVMSPTNEMNNVNSISMDAILRNVQASSASVDESVEVNSVDTYPNFTRRTTPYTRAFGKYGRGEYEFAEPSGVFYCHDGSLAVCDAKNHRIVIFDSEGSYIRSIGDANDLTPLSDTPSDPSDPNMTRIHGKLYYPFRAAQCPRTYNIVVVERPPSLTIQVFSFAGELINSFGHTKLSYPRGLAVDECGFIFVVESRTMKFFIFNQNGDEIAQKYLANHLQFPNDIVARQGQIYISDNRSHCVHVFDYNLNCVGNIGNESLTYFPIGVSLSHSNHIIITDNHNTFNITVFDINGHLVCGFKSRSKHANCYNVALHPFRHELAVTTKECKVLIFNFNTWSEMPQ